MAHTRHGYLWPLAIICVIVALYGCDGGGAGEDGEPCITETSPTAGRLIPCRGLVYTVSTPDGCQHGGCGLIFDVHGSTGDADIQEAGTQLRRLGRHATPPFVVVQPNAGGSPPDWSGADDDRVFVLSARGDRRLGH